MSDVTGDSDDARDAAELLARTTALAATVAERLGPDRLTPTRAIVAGAVVDGLAPHELIELAIVADWLRIVQLTARDGRSDKEVDSLVPILDAISGRFRRVLLRYGSVLVGRSTRLARSFKATHADDPEPFGYRHEATMWLGRRLARASGDAASLEGYRRLAAGLVDRLASSAGRDERERRVLQDAVAGADDEDPLAATTDDRLAVFLSSPLVVFASAAQASQIDEPDPFDVDAVHADARNAFESVVDTATDASARDQARLLLILGESGSGKTHLLRALRASLHGRGRGYAVYVQLHSRSEDYARYVLSKVVDSMERPYDHTASDRTGLLLLSNGLIEKLLTVAADDVARLRSENPDDERHRVDIVHALVDHLLLEPGFGVFDPDFLRCLLFLQCRDPRVTPRVAKFLRCEQMNEHDRRQLAGVVTHSGPDAPVRMIRAIAQLAWMAQRRSLVFLLDQVEDQSYRADGNGSFLRAVDTLRSLTDEVPSIAAVIACLEDLYQAVRPNLVASAIDRLERHPTLQRLHNARTFGEIEAVAARRLEYLYEQHGVRFDPDDRLYPVPPAALEPLANVRLRDVLDFLHDFREECRAQHRIVAIGEAAALPPPEPAAEDFMLVELDQTWNDECARALDLPVEAPALVELLRQAVRYVMRELAPDMIVEHRRDGDHLEVRVGDGPLLLVALVNQGYQGGAFAKALAGLQRAAGDRIPMAARTSEFPNGKQSRAAIADFHRQGGRRQVVPTADLRAVVAIGALRDQYGDDTLISWLQARRPVSALASIRALLALDDRSAEALTGAGATGPSETSVAVPVPEAPAASLIANEGAEATDPATPAEVEIEAGEQAAEDRRAPARDAAAPRQSPAVTADTPVLVGQLDGLQGGRHELPVDQFRRHAAVFGAPGSGKTTTALGIVEQLLERGIPAILIDRKGDLAGYARPQWWAAPADTAERTDRKQSLRESVEVRLFTPGTKGGRPLALSVIPALEGFPAHEQTMLIQHASAALADLARLSPNSPHRSILTVAVDLLARTNAQASLPQLIELIADRDAALVNEARLFEERDFNKLAQSLDSVRIFSGELFDPHDEQLAADALLAPGPSGRVPLSIVNTQFLGDRRGIQPFLARLISELARHSARRPSPTLQALVMFDEADEYLPAGMHSPPTKQPMLDLLRRARSGGIGVMLATQSPGDFDYRARDLISTWMIGKIGDQRSIGKMRPLFESHRASIATKLPRLRPGQFQVMDEGGVHGVQVAPALLETEQLGTTEITELAAQSRP